ncbi:MAG: amidohydrolase family protein [Hyphomicrobiales bacterium]
MPKILIGFTLFLFTIGATSAQELPIFDGHVHYSQNSWDTLSPAEAEERMKRANVNWALVSSSPDAGTLMLFKQMPKRVVPELRPYHDNVNSSNWVDAPDITKYLKNHLETGIYKGIGEFHLHGTSIYNPEVLSTVAKLAQDREILLHVHAGAEQITRLFELSPNITILWAHVGFEDSTDLINDMMKKFPKLYSELSFRASDVDAGGGEVTPEWRALFDAYPERFIVGTDTYIAPQWQRYESLVQEHRDWLKTLPRPLAEKIAWRNAVKLFNIEDQ